MKYILCIIISYFLGNLLFAYIFGKLFKKRDLRELGSHNPGSTNAVRVFGVKIGGLAFLFDFFKGIIACFVGLKIAGYYGLLLSGLFVVIGHNWPMFFNFQGGKGIASSCGVLLMYDYRLFFVAILFFMLVFFLKKIVSLASITASLASMVIGCFILNNVFGKLMLVCLALMAFIRHKDNIKRLIHNEEKPIV